MNDILIFGALLLSLWLLRDRARPLKMVVYASDGSLAWESWTQPIDEKPKAFYTNSSDHILEAYLDNNSQNAISIDMKAPDNQNTQIGIPAGVMERILIPVGNTLYGQSYTKSYIDVLIVYNSELILK